MFSKTTTLSLLSLAALASAAVIPRVPDAAPAPANATAAVTITPAQILAIAPTSGTCDGASFPDECADNTRSAAAISAAFSQFGIATAGEQAALISLMAFETGDFKFNINHFPGRPGQGTRNLQFANFNLLYAQDIPELADQANAIAQGRDTTAMSDDELNQILALVLPDQFSFASAGWFLTTQCDPSIRTALATGGEPGWEQYITTCVGTTVTDDRQAYFDRAVTALA